MPLIVIAEGDKLVRRIYRSLLEEASYRVQDTGQAAEALGYCFQGSVDMAIIDTFLPEEEGLQLIRQLRLQRASIKIIALTGGMLNTGLRTQVVKTGVDGLLDKPFAPSELLSLVREVLGPSSEEHRPPP